jgi:hypothetical protein
LLFGVNSALGVYVQDRSTFTGSREAMHATYQENAAELRIVETQLQSLSRHRSVGEVDAAIKCTFGTRCYERRSDARHDWLCFIQLHDDRHANAGGVRRHRKPSSGISGGDRG